MPGGFGKRGIEGMLNAIRYAREKKVPYFGICLGMQTACIEFARNVCGLADANSSEFDPGNAASRHLQAARTARRGRTGRHHAAGRVALQDRTRTRWPTRSTARPRSASATAIATSSTANTKSTLTAGGLRISGSTPDGTYVEIVEIPDHPYFLGCQFHPEFKSKPLEPHPLFKAFIGAAYEHGLQAPHRESGGRGRDVPSAGESGKAVEQFRSFRVSQLKPKTSHHRGR